MKRNLIPALALCSALLIQSVSASAAYSGADEIALTLRSRSLPEGTTLTDDGTIHIGRNVAEVGLKLPLSIYIEAPRAEISLLGIKLQSDSPSVTFNADSLHSPAAKRYETPQEFLIPGMDTPVLTQLEPYCLGEVSSTGTYNSKCYSCNLNADPEDNSLTVYWMYGIGQAESFLGGASDAFSFIDFAVDIAPGTAPGTYRIDFLAGEDAESSESQRLTYVTSDNGTMKESVYTTILPAMNGMTIVVDDADRPVRGDANGDSIINAEDAAAVLIYAADKGAGAAPVLSDDPDLNEALIAQADVNEDASVDASDAAAILLYAAAAGAGEDVTWSAILGS